MRQAAISLVLSDEPAGFLALMLLVWALKLLTALKVRIEHAVRSWQTEG